MLANVAIFSSKTGSAAVTYATWNPDDKDANVALSGGNLTATRDAGVGVVRSTIGKSSGKWYWEITMSTASDQSAGIANASSPLTEGVLGDTGNTNAWGCVCDDGNKFHDGNQGAYLTAFANGDIMGVALNMTDGEISINKNNSAFSVMFTGVSGTIFAAFCVQNNAAVGTANFGATAMTYTAPSGYNTGLYN